MSRRGRPPGYYVDEDTTDAFLDAPPLRYESGSRDDAIRAAGVDPDDPAAIKRKLAELGWTVPPLTPPTFD